MKKKVKALVGIVPVALGAAAPLAAPTLPNAMASTNDVSGPGKSVSVTPFNSGEICDLNVCISVKGTGNFVSKVVEKITHTKDEDDIFILRASSTRGAGTWKSAATGAFNGARTHTFTPDCYWPNITFVQGVAINAAGSPTVSIHGSNFQSAHRCGFLT